MQMIRFLNFKERIFIKKIGLLIPKKLQKKELIVIFTIATTTYNKYRKTKGNG